MGPGPWFVCQLSSSNFTVCVCGVYGSFSEDETRDGRLVYTTDKQAGIVTDRNFGVSPTPDSDGTVRCGCIFIFILSSAAAEEGKQLHEEEKEEEEEEEEKTQGILVEIG
ncbi:hypothetical protein CPC08DRAFT_730490 [Agrocybe pediades]|nr:hypothetical protein CPC08DRAFT_730490 [Agrocybe pediades]